MKKAVFTLLLLASSVSYSADYYALGHGVCSPKNPNIIFAYPIKGGKDVKLYKGLAIGVDNDSVNSANPPPSNTYHETISKSELRKSSSDLSTVVNPEACKASLKQ